MDMQTLAGSLLAAVGSSGASLSRDERSMREHAASVAQIASRFTALAGSERNALALVEALRDGVGVELLYPLAGTDPSPKVIGLVPPTAPMDWHDVRMALMLTRDALTGLGLLRPSGEQLHAALLGGEVGVPDARMAVFRGVLRMRAEGHGWGEIAAARFQRVAESRAE